MKKILLLAFAFIFSLNLLQAQRGQRDGSPEERINRQVERMTTDLSLSDAQAEKIKEVFTKYSEKMMELRKNMAEEDRGQMRDKFFAIRKEQNEELKKYLTADQLEKYQKLEEERRARRGERGPRRDGERG
jgi:Spy/CpxP family protein refolding chaperone